MVAFTKSLIACGTPRFETEFKRELSTLPLDSLPLRNAMLHSSLCVDGSVEPMVLSVSDEADALKVKAGVFFTGVDAGSCCADDPSGPCEQTEYCEILVVIDKASGKGNIILLDE